MLIGHYHPSSVPASVSTWTGTISMLKYFIAGRIMFVVYLLYFIIVVFYFVPTHKRIKTGFSPQVNWQTCINAQYENYYTGESEARSESPWFCGKT